MATTLTADYNRLRTGVLDGMIMTKRALMHIPRVPELLFFSTIQPIMFVLLFAYVFGGAIHISGGNGYREYLLAGVFVQTVAFSTGATAVGLAEDMQKGLIDRFRSLPMARSAVLVGRTLSDVVRNAFMCVIMVACGYVVGWRVRDGALKAIAAFALILLFAYSLTWIGALIGLSVRNSETANTAGFVWLFPLTFLSVAFVTIQGMPGWLQHVAIWNPVTAVVTAGRVLFGNPNPFLAHAHAFPLRHPVIVSILWSLLILAIFVPLAVRKYARVAGH